MSRVGFLMLFLILAGCAGTSTPSTTGSCDMRNASQPVCDEYTQASADELALDAEVMCTDHQGTWAGTFCPRPTVLGGCASTITGPYGSFTLTDWFYPGGAVVTAADVMARCTTLGAQYVAP